MKGTAPWPRLARGIRAWLSATPWPLLAVTASLASASLGAQQPGASLGRQPGARVSQADPGSFDRPLETLPPPGGVGVGYEGSENAPVPRGDIGMPGGDRASEAAGLVVGVEVLGNEVVKESRILGELKTRKDRQFDPEVLQADVRRLLKTGLFRNVETRLRQGPDGVVVTFQVYERPMTRYLKYIGNRSFSDKTLSKHSGVKQAEPLNVFNVNEGRRRLEEFYHSKGFADIDIEIFEGNRAGDQGVVYVINEGHLQRISRVEFVGNDPKLATDARLKTLIQSRPGYAWYLLRGKVDRKKIDEDIERVTAYYRGLGYFRAKVSRELQFDDSQSWLTLRFVIDEGPRYAIRRASVIGNEKFTSESLMGQLQLQSGDYFNEAKMRRDENQLKDLYGAEGFVFANVTAEPRYLEEPGQVDLVYKIEEGEQFRVGKINVKIAGDNPHTRQSVVLNRLSVYPGSLCDMRELRSSERRLRYSQLFETEDPNRAPKVTPIPPDLQELESVASRKRRPSVRGQSPH